MRVRSRSFAASCAAVWAVLAGMACAAVPGPPTGVVAIPGDARATVYFDPPASDGGSPITLYTVRSSPPTVVASGTSSPIIFTGLANNTSYTIVVRAENASGLGDPSTPSNAITPIPPGIAPAVSTAESFSLALDTHGQVYAWGSDGNGQLGQGRRLLQTSPTQVSGLPAIQHIALFEHALAVDTSGQVWSWGDNCGGQLGPRDSAVTSKPARVIGVTGMTKVAAGYCRSYSLKANGTVWTWSASASSIQALPFPSGIVDIASGGTHLLALANDGKVYAYGSNSKGELGQGDTTARSDVVQVQGLPDPVASPVVEIAAGFNSSLVRLQNGELRFWGQYSGLQPPATLPTPVAGLGGSAIAIAVSNTGIAAVRDIAGTRTVWRWIGTIDSPTEVTGMPGAAKLSYSQNKRTLFSISTAGALVGNGDNNNGQLGQGNTNPVVGSVAVPGFAAGTSLVRVGFFSAAVLALKSDGSVWFWGENEAGQRGDAASIGSSVPRAVPIPATIKSIATAYRFGAALDTLDRVWGWGENSDGQLDIDQVNRSTPALITGISGVAAIAAGGYGSLVYAKAADKTAWVSGIVPYLVPGGRALRQVTGLPNIVGVAASLNSVFFLSETGQVWGAGGNSFGEMGDGTTASRASPVPVLGITGTVTKVVAAEFRVCALTSDKRVYTWGSDYSGQSLTGGTNIPVQIPGITDAVDVAVSGNGVLVRRQDGSILALGITGLADAVGQNTSLPFPVAFHEPVQAFALGQQLGFLVGNTGLLWGWGSSSLSSILGSVGDGTYVKRNRPVVTLAHAGGGSLDADNWYLDLQPATAEAIPVASIPKALATSRLFGGTGALGFDGTVKYKSADLGKRVNNYVVALVPPSFFAQVKTAPGTSSIAKLQAKAAKAAGFVLVQLTPAGWTDVNGQLIAYSQGVANAAGGASNILNGINSTLIPGSRFCVGYGESADSMLTSSALREVLLLDGAAATASGVPCVLSGVYVNGPPSSVQFSPVTFTASLVGISPTGAVQFKDGTGTLGAPAALAAANPAVSQASLTTSSLAVGTHSIGAEYPGNAQNPAAVSETAKLHTVSAPLAQTQVAIEGPASSSLASEVAFVATVTGNNPTGTVQFKDGIANLGAAAPVVGGVATLRTSALALSPPAHSITAAYSGDGLNTIGTSGPLAHTVVNVIATRVQLASSSNPSNAGAAVTFTATVTGSSPGGTLTLRDGAATLASGPLSAGAVSFTLSALAGGVHALTAHYSGDGANAPASSPTLFQDVSLPPVLLNYTASRTGGGTGTIASNPAGIDCGATCTGSFLSGTSVTLTATPAAGSVFVGWSGDCAGSAPCTLPMSAVRNATARFEVAGTGVGTAPASLAFGGQSMNTTSPAQSASLTNSSGATIVVSSVVAPPGYGVTHNCASLAAAANCTLTVSFTPVAEGAAAANVLVLYTQDAQTRASLLPVTGTGERSLVTHYYRSILRRAPDAGGKVFWDGEAARMQSLGVNVNETWYSMAGSFYTSAEYLAFGRDDNGFVTDLYNTFFNRPPDGAGLAYWTGQLASGLPREVALVSFMFSTEFVNFTQAIFGNTAVRKEIDTVVDFYRGLLGRLPDNGGFNFWVAQFRAAQCQGAAAVTAQAESISSQFALSPEYTARGRNNSQYVGDLYNAFLRRGGDLAGVQFWIGQVATGAQTREQVRKQFVASPEFSGRVAAIIAQGCLP